MFIVFSLIAVFRGIVGIDVGQGDEVGIKGINFHAAQVGEVCFEGVGCTTFDDPLGTVSHWPVSASRLVVEVKWGKEIHQFAVFVLTQFAIALDRIICGGQSMFNNGIVDIVELGPIELSLLPATLYTEAKWRMERWVKGKAEDSVAGCEGAVVQHWLGHIGKILGESTYPEIRTA